MDFPYGLSHQRYKRWAAFHRILKVQSEQGSEVGAGLLRHLVSAELQAIERATLEHERGVPVRAFRITASR